MLSTIQLNNLRDAAKHAWECEVITHVPSELILAQWVLESGWGQHSPGNNCFGIKEYPECYGIQLLYTTEYFTPAEKESWLAAVKGRCAELQNQMFLPNTGGRQRYLVQDWFATFLTLTDCFKKRAALFNTPTYAPFLAQYDLDHNIVKLVQGIAKIYATDPNYSNEILQIAGMHEVLDAIKMAKSGG